MTQSLMGWLLKRDDLDVTQIVSRSSFRLKESSVHTRHLPFRTDWMLGRLLGDNFHPAAFRKDFDLWFYPKGYLPRYVRPSQPTVGMMHDTILQHYADHYPETRSPSAFRYWIETTKRSLEGLSKVLTVSRNAASQLVSFCERHHINPPAIEVTYEGSQWEQVLGQDFEKHDRVIHLASVSPHKRTNPFLRLWLEASSRREMPKLLLVGQLDDEGETLAGGIRDLERLSSQSLEDLQKLVGQSRALVLPSEIEGFGLPALEAYYCHTPVVFTRGTSIDEVVGKDAMFGAFEMPDCDQFLSALDWAWSLPAKEKARLAQSRYDEFSLETVSQRVFQAFNACRL